MYFAHNILCDINLYFIIKRNALEIILFKYKSVRLHLLKSHTHCLRLESSESALHVAKQNFSPFNLVDLTTFHQN